MTPDEAAVLPLLPRGRANAISMRALSSRSGVPPRKVQEAVVGLIARGVPIGSVTRAPAGFFICETEEDVAVAARHLRSKAMAVLVRLRAFRFAAEASVGVQGNLLELDADLLDEAVAS
jgi:hypothetical protein